MYALLRSSRRGITLIEVLIIIAIIAVLIALLLPAIWRSQRAAARAQCMGLLKQLATGLLNYADTHRTPSRIWMKLPRFPAGTVPNVDLTPERRLSWFVEVLPYLEQNAVYRSINREAAWDAATNATATHTPQSLFRCPEWERETWGSPTWHTGYIGVAGVGADAPDLPSGDRRAGIFGYNRGTLLADVKDGMSNTLLILESARNNGPWAQGGPVTVRGIDPADRPYLGTGRPFGGTHFEVGSVFSGQGASVICNAAMADSSIRFLSESVSPQVLEALATIAGGEQVGTDW